MPNFISIEASELESFGQQIAAAPELIKTVSGTFVSNTAKDVLGFVRTYPPPARGIKQPFVSDKQRRFFFAALRSGRIQVPYQRTGHQGFSWLYRLVPGESVFVAEVYNTNDRYHRLVQGRKSEQARIHRGRWKSQEEIEEAAEGFAEKRLREAESELERLFLLRLGR
jgi:hypothetical protein